MNVLHLQHPPRESKPAPLTPNTSEDYILNPEMRNWARKRGVSRLEERYEHFVDYLANREGKPYRDLLAAFRNACRQDWAKLGFPKFQAEPETCCKCHGSIARGHTITRDGKCCNDCWAHR